MDNSISHRIKYNRFDLKNSSPNFTFTDIDECLDNNGGCTNNCYNTYSSYYCTCPDHLEMSADGRTCYGM